MEFYENELRTARALRVLCLRGMIARGWKSLIRLLRPQPRAEAGKR